MASFVCRSSSTCPDCRHGMDPSTTLCVAGLTYGAHRRPRQVIVDGTGDGGTLLQARKAATAGSKLGAEPAGATAGAAAAPAVRPLPAGLRRLRALATALTAAQPDLERDLRVVVTVPTLRLAGVVAALGSVLTPVDCTGCTHTDLTPGARVAYVESGRFTDATLTAVSDREISFGGFRLVKHFDAVHRLPDGFPDSRVAARMPDDTRAAVAAALGCSPDVAAHRHSARCTHPVVVAGEPGAFADDLAALDTAGLALHLRGRLDAGRRLDDWFRHPVLAMSTIPDLTDVPWAAALRPRLVILTGSAGWAASCRRIWPQVPVLALLSRRSPAAVETAGLIATSGWPAPEAFPASLAPLLQPAAGLEILTRLEPTAVDEDGEVLW